MRILKLNPKNALIVKSHFYAFLIEGGYNDSTIETVKGYLKEFDLSIENNDELQVLKSIHNYYFYKNIVPVIRNDG